MATYPLHWCQWHGHYATPAPDGGCPDCWQAQTQPLLTKTRYRCGRCGHRQFLDEHHAAQREHPAVQGERFGPGQDEAVALIEVQRCPVCGERWWLPEPTVD